MSNELTIDSIIKAVTETVVARPEQIKLTKSTKVGKFADNDVRKLLRTFYASKELELRLFATLLNGIFTQKRIAFLMSRPVMDELLTGDVNMRKRNSVRSDEWTEFMTWAIQAKHIKRIATGKGHQASVYKLTNQALVDLLSRSISRDIFSLQETQALDLFNEYDKSSSNSSSNSSSATATAIENASANASAVGNVPRQEREQVGSLNRVVGRRQEEENVRNNSVPISPHTSTSSWVRKPDSEFMDVPLPCDDVIARWNDIRENRKPSVPERFELIKQLMLSCYSFGSTPDDVEAHKADIIEIFINKNTDAPTRSNLVKMIGKAFDNALGITILEYFETGWGKAMEEALPDV